MVVKNGNLKDFERQLTEFCREQLVSSKTSFTYSTLFEFHCEQAKVDIELRGEPDDARFWLAGIEVKESYRGQSIGSDLMQAILKVADDFSLDVNLSARPYEHPLVKLFDQGDDLSDEQAKELLQAQKDLASWYERFGIETVQDGDLDMGCEMYRVRISERAAEHRFSPEG